jgi:hypothetical protein
MRQLRHIVTQETRLLHSKRGTVCTWDREVQDAVLFVHGLSHSRRGSVCTRHIQDAVLFVHALSHSRRGSVCTCAVTVKTRYCDIVCTCVATIKTPYCLYMR